MNQSVALEELHVQIDACQLALITIGNSGKGKTLIDNIILGDDVFTHMYRATSVTRLTEAAFTTVNGMSTVVYNVPGLREIIKANVAANKVEIAKAFARQPNQVIVVVFGVGDGGRIVQEDVATYTSIVEAFDLTRTSTVFVMNNVRPEFNTPEYQAETTLVLREAVEWPEDTPLRVVFSPSYRSRGADIYADPDVLAFRSNLMKAITTAMPFKHVQQKDIQTSDDTIREAQARLNTIYNDMEALRTRHAEEMNDLTERIKEQTRINAENAARYQRELDEARQQMHTAMMSSMRSSRYGGGGGNRVSASYSKGGFSCSFSLEG